MIRRTIVSALFGLLIACGGSDDTDSSNPSSDTGSSTGDDTTDSGTGDGDGDPGTGDGDGDDDPGDGDPGDGDPGDGDGDSCPEGNVDCPCFPDGTCVEPNQCINGTCHPGPG